MGNYKRLIMVTPDNNNKWYELIHNDGSTFTAKWGRIEGNTSTQTYPISKWQSKYSEKLRKGYKDVTDLVGVKEVNEEKYYAEITNQIVNKFVTLMKKYTDNLVSRTYSVKATNVTLAQIEAAQNLLNKLNLELDTKKINELLIELYMVIPRWMKDVRRHILPHIDLKTTLIQEQDNIDAMSSQVSIISNKDVSTTKSTFLDTIGIKMEEVSPPKEVKYLIDQLTSRKIAGFFKVVKEKEDIIFENWLSKQDNKSTRFLIHGTRCSSVIPILEQGLKIRPSGNYQFSGKVYGDGNYFSEVVSKSINYTGNNIDKVLLVFEVHTGNPFVYDGWYRGNPFGLNYSELKSRGFDSTYVNAGNGLLNSEIITYKEEQCRIKYIIYLN